MKNVLRSGSVNLPVLFFLNEADKQLLPTPLKPRLIESVSLFAKLCCQAHCISDKPSLWFHGVKKNQHILLLPTNIKLFSVISLHLPPSLFSLLH